jgi:DNA-directed RNA polymerase specialized sigma24 family protein
MDELVRRAVAGDARALDQLCRQLEGAVFGLCLRMLGSLEDAKDATQEILVKVITHLSDFEGRSLSRAHQRLETFLKVTCGVANPQAACRCERQVPAKRAVGLPPDHARLDRLVHGEDVVNAALELRDVRQVLVADGQLVPPPSIHERLKAHLPTLLR